jgi:predicted MFS family arabinose efflux permease
MSFGAACALGFARFSYALLLPSMAERLHWSYVVAGSLAVVNAVGYFTGAALASPLVRRFGAIRTFYVALAVLVPIVALVGTTTLLPVILCCRALSGICGATVFIVGGALVAHRTQGLPARLHAACLGVYYGGAGLGTALSGIGIGALIQARPAGWAVGWYLLGGACLAGWLVARLVRHQLIEVPTQEAHERPPKVIRALWPTYLSYAIFGAGYMSYMTFVIAYYEHFGAPQSFSIWFYGVLGLMGAVSGFLWQRIHARLRKGYGLATTIGTVFVGTVLGASAHSSLIALLSALCFGAAFMATSTAMTKIAQRNLAPSQLTKAIGVATVAIGIGQSAGPLLGGALSDTASGLQLGMWSAAGLVGIAMVCSLLQRDRSPLTSPVEVDR